MTALKIVIAVPEGEQYQAAVATRLLAQPPLVQYIKPGGKLELFLEEGAHVDVGKAKLPPALER